MASQRLAKSIAANAADDEQLLNTKTFACFFMKYLQNEGRGIVKIGELDIEDEYKEGTLPYDFGTKEPTDTWVCPRL